jgi:hypothetical protein
MAFLFYIDNTIEYMFHFWSARQGSAEPHIGAAARLCDNKKNATPPAWLVATRMRLSLTSIVRTGPHIWRSG